MCLAQGQAHHKSHHPCTTHSFAPSPERLSTLSRLDPVLDPGGAQRTPGGARGSRVNAELDNTRGNRRSEGTGDAAQPAQARKASWWRGQCGRGGCGRLGGSGPRDCLVS